MATDLKLVAEALRSMSDKAQKVVDDLKAELLKLADELDAGPYVPPPDLEKAKEEEVVVKEEHHEDSKKLGPKKNK